LFLGTAVLLMDDDLLIAAQDVQFAFRVWKVGMEQVNTARVTIASSY